MQFSNTSLKFLLLAAIVALMGFQVLTVRQVEEHGSDSSAYTGLAAQLLSSGVYEFNGRPHVLYPPGFPVLLCAISLIHDRQDYFTYVRWGPVFAGVGLVLWYSALRTVTGPRRAVAAVLLVACSAPLYLLNTRVVNSDMPYFALSGLGVVSFVRVARSHALRAAVWMWLITASLAFAAAVLVRSAGISLAAAALAWAVHMRHRKSASARASSLPGLLAAAPGVLVFVLWLGWASRATKADYPGEYIGSYMEQFLLKNPRQPDLGAAAILDLPTRAASNAVRQVAHLCALAVQAPWISPVVYSPLVLGAIVLLAAGLRRLMQSLEGSFVGWYFIAYLGVYALWPFDEGPRFMLPVAPLAIGIMFSGFKPCVELFLKQPARVLFILTGSGAVLFVVGLLAARGAQLTGTQEHAAILFWLLVACAGALLLRFDARGEWTSKLVASGRTLVSGRVGAAAGAVIVLLMCGVGFGRQVAGARDNSSPVPAAFRHSGTVAAAEWLRDKPAGRVMAQYSVILHRLSGRNIVAFPITKDAKVIMAAIRYTRTRYLVVNDPKKDEYYLPPECERLESVQNAYPGALRLVHRGSKVRIFEVRQEQ